MTARQSRTPVKIVYSPAHYPSSSRPAVPISLRRGRVSLAFPYAFLLAATARPAASQSTPADYARAESVRKRLAGLVVDVVDTAAWIGNSSRFWYRKSVTGGAQFMIADAATREKKAAFDHA